MTEVVPQTQESVEAFTPEQLETLENETLKWVGLYGKHIAGMSLTHAGSPLEIADGLIGMLKMQIKHEELKVVSESDGGFSLRLSLNPNQHEKELQKLNEDLSKGPTMPVYFLRDIIVRGKLGGR